MRGYDLRSAHISRLAAVAALVLALTRFAFPAEPEGDSGGPQELKAEAATLVYYQPQVDDWQNFGDLDFRMAFTLTPKGAETVVGVVAMHGETLVNVDDRYVRVTNFAITETSFPSLSAEEAVRMDKLTRSLLKPGHTVILCLDRFMALATKPKESPTVSLKNEPPKIFVSYGPTIVLQSDGQPVRGKVPDTTLQFVVNSNWPVFFDTDSSNYYLFDDTEWLVATSSNGPWTAASSTAYGNTAAAKTGSGNMYADHNGNVYKKTDGSWQKYSNGRWSSVSPSGARSSTPSENLNQEYQNRQRGEYSNVRYQGSGSGWGGSRSFGGFSGRSFGGGWGRGGGFRR